MLELHNPGAAVAIFKPEGWMLALQILLNSAFLTRSPERWEEKRSTFYGGRWYRWRQLFAVIRCTDYWTEVIGISTYMRLLATFKYLMSELDLVGRNRSKCCAPDVDLRRQHTCPSCALDRAAKWEAEHRISLVLPLKPAIMYSCTLRTLFTQCGKYHKKKW